MFIRFQLETFLVTSLQMITFNTNKAGMEGIDRKKVEKVIAENTSANYSSFSNKQEQRVEKRVSEIKKRLSSVTPTEWTNASKEMDHLTAQLESGRDLDRHCVHVDMDAYFAAVEMRDEPKLRDVPMAVGSAAMLGTSNYIARRFGVRAAMPGFIAKKLCPQLEIVPGNYDKYSRESKIFSAVFAEYDSDLCMGSLDEAYIDITDFMRSRTQPCEFDRVRYGGKCVCRLPLIDKDEETRDLKSDSTTCITCGNERITYTDKVSFGCTRGEVVREMRFRVEQITGLTCSAGIAANFMLAKVCSDMKKPNGQFELSNQYDVIMDFLGPLPIRKVSGIGRVTEAHLAGCQVTTVGELLEKRASLKFAFSPLQQESLLRTALGLPGRPRPGDPQRKSVSVERTFSPTSDPTELRSIVSRICDQLADDIAQVNVIGGRCVTLKVKLSSFDVLTRSSTLPSCIFTASDIAASALDILSRELGQEMRLLGVRLSHLKFKGDLEDGKSEKSILEFWQSAKRRKMAEVDADASTQEMVPSTSSSKPDDVESDNIKCPICDISIANDDRVINNHVDLCLNSSLVHNAVQLKPTLPKKKKPSNGHSITNYFTPL